MKARKQLRTGRPQNKWSNYSTIYTLDDPGLAKNDSALLQHLAMRYNAHLNKPHKFRNGQSVKTLSQDACNVLMPVAGKRNRRRYRWDEVPLT